MQKYKYIDKNVGSYFNCHLEACSFFGHVIDNYNK